MEVEEMVREGEFIATKRLFSIRLCARWGSYLGMRCSRAGYDARKASVPQLKKC